MNDVKRIEKRDEELIDEVRDFLEKHFQPNYDHRRFILYRDFIDFIWENTEFNIIRVKRLLNSWNDWEVHNGKIYGLHCFTYPDINRIDDDATSSSSDDDDEYDELEDDLESLIEYDSS